MALLENRTRLQTIFDHSPMCIWEEDFSSVKQFVDTLKSQGVTDLRGFLHQHPEAVAQCEQSIRVLDINQTALHDIQIATKPVLMNQLADLMARGPQDVFIEEIIAIAEGKTEFQFEGANDLIDGVVRFEDVRWMVAPGYEQDYGRLIVTFMNVTERRLAEEKTRYLSTHDVLTGLYNRNFFEAELERLQHSRLMPMNILIADVNGLKQTNDTLGHFAGDELLRQAAQALRQAFRKEDIIARTGGDEFTVLFPGNIAPQEAEKRLHQSVAEMNQKRPDLPLSLAIGAAAAECGQSLLETYKRADQKMYGEKARIKNAA
jgi:diguanylate cyclase (GGDEF)-like protein